MFVCHRVKFVLIRVVWTSSGTLSKFRDLDVYFKSLDTLDDLDDAAGPSLRIACVFYSFYIQHI